MKLLDEEMVADLADKPDVMRVTQITAYGEDLEYAEELLKRIEEQYGKTSEKYKKQEYLVQVMSATHKQMLEQMEAEKAEKARLESPDDTLSKLEEQKTFAKGLLKARLKSDK